MSIHYKCYKKYLRIKDTFSIMNKISKLNKRIVLVGDNIESKILEYFFSKSDNYWGKVIFSAEKVGRNISELLYEDIQKFVVVLTEQNLLRKYEGYFLDIGFSVDQLISVINDGIGSHLNIYDPIIGYTKRSETGLPGISIFGEIQKERDDKFIVFTLGGSTTDPSTGNLISWSEYLYRDLSKLHDNVQVVCAGVNSQVVSQELLKLIRDAYLFSPDFVISYSGVNDFSEYYHDEITPFMLNYQKRVVKEAIRKRILRGEDVLQGGIVNESSWGVESECPISRASHWIRCEKIMKSICDGFDWDFIGILQPQNFRDQDDSKVAMRNKYYPEAKQKLQEENLDWLLDFTDIFEKEENVFYDNCHVYEVGNRIIEAKILPYVIKSMTRKGII